MRRAIVSDLHSNTEALHAVMADIATEQADEIVCLGDVVGYGPEPEACIDFVEEKCRFCLSGNHDYAVITHAERFNPLAEEAVAYTRDLLKPTALSMGRKRCRWHFLEALPTRVTEGDVLYVHGSPRDDRNEYILPSDILFGNIAKIREIFSLIPRLLFIGHSHLPGIIGEDVTFWHPEGAELVRSLSAEGKYLINVGSVGQPRDGDNRACYVIVEGDRIEYRRIAYDFRATMKKMSRVGPLSRDAADRLEHGR